MSAKIAEVHPGIYEIFLPLPMRPTIINVYLIDCHGAWTLIDTGMNTADSIATLEEAFKQVGTRLEDLNTESRYPAARSAALAGCGLGKDGAKLSDAERTRWRKEARAWLQADLAVWAKTLDSGSPVARDLAKTMLTQWQVDPDLVGLREPNALDKLSVDERKECLALWNEVGAALNRTQMTK